LERWVGIAVSSERITVVDATVEPGKPLVINADQSFKLQQAGRPQAYRTIHDQVVDYLTTHGIERVVVKASAVSQGGSGLGHLEAAEVRGVVMAAAASVCAVTAKSKSQVSKTFGTQKFDEYVKDEAFWTKSVAGVALKKGSREAALLLLAERGK
jgi:hypothetical protein